MKTKIEIKSIFGKILFEFEKEDNTIKDTLLEAINSGADLSYANLSDANLSDANLSDADLSYADLSYANLRRANLRRANLSYANLSDANLSYANLSDANLRRADLSDANLSDADLSNISINEFTAFINICCPEEGSFIAFKKASGKIVKLQITEDALRSSSTSLKCRASKALVIEIEGGLTQVCSDRDQSFIYKVGEIVEVKDFDKNRWEECSTGIHFFLSKEQARQWNN